MSKNKATFTISDETEVLLGQFQKYGYKSKSDMVDAAVAGLCKGISQAKVQEQESMAVVEQKIANQMEIHRLALLQEATSHIDTYMKEFVHGSDFELAVEEIAERMASNAINDLEARLASQAPPVEVRGELKPVAKLATWGTAEED